MKAYQLRIENESGGIEKEFFYKTDIEAVKAAMVMIFKNYERMGVKMINALIKHGMNDLKNLDMSILTYEKTAVIKPIEII